MQKFLPPNLNFIKNSRLLRTKFYNVGEILHKGEKMKDFKSFHSAFQTLVKALLAVSLLHLALFSESEHPPLSPHTKKASARC